MSLKSLGFSVVEEVFSSGDLERLRRESDRLAEPVSFPGGLRNVLARSEIIWELASTGTANDLARTLLGESARPVNGRLFDKREAANWKVPWHQDLTIAVRARKEIQGFGPWSVKDGVPHVQPPVEILEEMIALRIHLDDTPAENGALRVVPGSHRQGRLSREDATALRRSRGEIACPVRSGGIMAMRPLLLHASSASTQPGRRRVLHLEYASRELPGGLEWPVWQA